VTAALHKHFTETETSPDADPDPEPFQAPGDTTVPCGNGCDADAADDAVASHWCVQCQLPICSVCVMMHRRQVALTPLTPPRSRCPLFPISGSCRRAFSFSVSLQRFVARGDAQAWVGRGEQKMTREHELQEMQAHTKNHVSPGTRRRIHHLSPLVAPAELLRRLPSCAIMASELDPLLDDSIMFTRRLHKLGRSAPRPCTSSPAPPLHLLVLVLSSAKACVRGSEHVERVGQVG